MNTLDSIKIGDLVLISRRESEGIAKVTKVTPQYFHCGVYRFRKKDGHTAGADSYNWVCASIPSQEDIDRVRNKNRSNRLRNELLELIKTASLEQLEKIHSSLQPS